MYISVYLHKPIVDILKCYGSLSDVTNRILDLADVGAIDLWDKPLPPPRDGAGRYDILVTNETYIDLVNNASNTHRLSLRRILYWFVENEMYNEFCWNVVHPYTDSDKQKQINKINKCVNIIEHLVKKCSYKNECNEILEKLNNLKELINHG